MLYHLHVSQCLYLCLRISDSMLMVFGETGSNYREVDQSQVPGLTETFNLTDLTPFQKYKFRLYADYQNLPSGEPFADGGDTTELTTSSKYACHAKTLG